MRKIWDKGAYGAGGAYGAVRSLGPMFLAYFSDMADLLGKRHAYSWIDNKILGKSAIKKWGHFSRGRPFKE